MVRSLADRTFQLRLALEGIAEDQDRAMRVLQASHSTGALALCNALRDSDLGSKEEVHVYLIFHTSTGSFAVVSTPIFAIK